MKKLVLTFVALVAVAATSFAQFTYSELASIDKALNSYSSPSTSFTMPSVSNSVASVANIIPSTVNYNTTPVSGYNRSNGTYVQPYVRTMPNSTNWDNFSTKGNSNPLTGSTGYRAKDYSRDAYNYGAGNTIHTGSRGGQFYYNSKGRKTYVPKRNIW